MIHYLSGNILESSAYALVNTVNLLGVMVKGIALQFKKSFPNNYKAYKQACQNKNIDIGKLFVTKENTVLGEKMIINFPTKTDWRKSSEYSYIDAGLDDLVKVISINQIKSVALPPLGSGNGGLYWGRVKMMIENKLSDLDIDIFVYEPSNALQEQMKSERVKLTDARALLLFVLFDLVRHGEFVSEFSSEKVCYFLQKFGAQDIFKLHFEPKYYGPYSGKVRYVLNSLNGSYIMGYSDMNKKPFDSLSLISDSYPDVKRIVENNPVLLNIASKTESFLDGFYSDFALELLSTVDYIMSGQKEMSTDDIYAQVSKWSYRKSKLFSDKKYIEIARNHIIKMA